MPELLSIRGCSFYMCSSFFSSFPPNNQSLESLRRTGTSTSTAVPALRRVPKRVPAPQGFMMGTFLPRTGTPAGTPAVEAVKWRIDYDKIDSIIRLIQL